jgi:hypothetical protein
MNSVMIRLSARMPAKTRKPRENRDRDLGFRSPALAGSLPWLRGQRGVQVVTDAEDPDEEARKHSAERGGQPVDPCSDRSDRDHRGAQGRDGVQTSLQHRRDLPEEDISQRPPAGAGDGAEDNGRGRPSPRPTALLAPVTANKPRPAVSSTVICVASLASWLLSPNAARPAAAATAR